MLLFKLKTLKTKSLLLLKLQKSVRFLLLKSSQAFMLLTLELALVLDFRFFEAKFGTFFLTALSLPSLSFLFLD